MILIALDLRFAPANLPSLLAQVKSVI